MKNTTENEYDYISVNDIAARLKCTRRTVHRWITAGQLEASKFGKIVRIKISDFEKFCDSQAKAS